MTGLMILADGFEDTEALSTRDILCRANIEVITSSISSSLEVKSSFGVTVKADCLLKNIKDLSDFQFVILPGGGLGFRNLLSCEFLKAYLDHFVLHNKLVCAICAAPAILGSYGYLNNHRYTCYAGFLRPEFGLFSGAEVEVDGNFITARSMKYSIDFALAIIDKLLDKETLEKVKIGIEGTKDK